jgi:hypothetical protein
MEAMKSRVRQITSRNGGLGLGHVVTDLRSYLVGWKAYSRLADTPGIFADVDQWLLRRPRMIIFKRWKLGTTTYRELRAHGRSDALARAAAARCRRWWRMTKHGVLHTAFPRQYFEHLGVPRLGPPVTSAH